MDVQALKSFVRDQMDVDSDDLPDSVLNVYLQEAFDRTMAFSNSWPRNEKVFEVSKVAGDSTITLPADLLVSSIMSVVPVSMSYPLIGVSHEAALSRYTSLSGITAVGQPINYSIFAGLMYLWPSLAVDDSIDLFITAYRQPVWDNAVSAIPDLDPRLHVTLAYFALSLAYAKEEDEVMEASYLGRWNRDLIQQLKTIMEPAHNRPLILGGGYPIGGAPGWRVVPPGV